MMVQCGTGRKIRFLTSFLFIIASPLRLIVPGPTNEMMVQCGAERKIRFLTSLLFIIASPLHLIAPGPASKMMVQCGTGRKTRFLTSFGMTPLFLITGVRFLAALEMKV